jgi:RNA polymerase sigma factor (TIGR02999 family)
MNRDHSALTYVLDIPSLDLSMGDVTRILDSIGPGDPQAAGELLPVVYQELRRLAAHKMASEAPGQTLQPTALVHEVWLKLTGNENRRWKDRAHFFAAAAEAMRRILVDNARRKRTARRGGVRGERVELEDLALVVPNEDQMLAVDEALEKFAAQDKEKADLVKLRYFVGMTIEETAEVLGISEGTAKRYWAYARAWLFEELRTADQKSSTTDGKG